MMSIRDRPYSAEDLAGALRTVGVKEGGVLFSHVSLGPLGLARGCRNTAEVCDLVVEGVRKALGPEGTFVVPTYTYSFTKDEGFDPAVTPSTVGPFTENFRSRPGVVRSCDPLFSVAADGPLAHALLANLPPTSFGPDCVYDRLWKHGAIIANLGMTIHYITYIHYVEAEWGAPYRFPKPFVGRMRINGAWKDLTWEHYARILVDNAHYCSKAFRQEALKQGKLGIASLGMGVVEAMRCHDIKTLAKNLLDENPWSFVQGPAFKITDDLKI